MRYATLRWGLHPLSIGGGTSIVLLIAFIWQFYTFSPLGTLGYDEMVYQFYVQTLEQSGVKGIRAVIHAWPSVEQLNMGPLPYRFLNTLLGSWADGLLGGETSANLARLSQMFSIGTVLATLLLIRRWFGPTTGLLTAILLVFSPLATHLSHRALQDACVGFFLITSIFFYDRCWREGKLFDLLLFGAVLLAGFLSKESAIFLYPSFFLVACYYALSMDWRRIIPVLIPLFLAPAIHFGIICWLSGDIQTCLDTYQYYFEMQHKIPYALKFQVGPWFRYLVDFILLSPVTFVLAIIGAAAQPVNHDYSKGRHIALVYLLSGLIVFSLLPLLNVRLVLFLDVFIRLFAVLGALTLCKQFPLNKFLSIYIGLVLALLIVSDITQFHTIFEVFKAYDPVTDSLVQGNGLVR